MKYRREVDGLRALAVIPVILFHAGLEQVSGGFVGVDVFFVISGYLITTIIIEELGAGNFSLVKFYERRARRILPPLFLVMAFGTPLAFALLTPSELKDFSQSLVAVPAFSSNILFWVESGYFDSSAELKPLLHTWSLAVEEQFYVLFPLFLMVAWPIGVKRIIVLLAIFATMSVAAAHWGAIEQPAANFYLLPTRGWELAIGSFVAFYFSRRLTTERNAVLDQILSIAGIVLILSGVFCFSETTPFPSAYALAPTIGTALVILFAWPQTYVGALLGSRTLVGIGLVSYSTYLWHQPLFAYARHASLGEPAWYVFALLTAVTLLLAYFTWRFVERPFRQKMVVSRAKVFRFAVTGSAAFMAVGVAGHVTNGFKDVKANQAQLDALSTAVSSPKRSECHTDGPNYRKPDEACEYHFKNSNIAVFGDSHTVELAYALADELKPYKLGIRHFSFSGCAPSFGRTTADKSCSEWTSEASTYISKNKAIETVVVSYRIHSALFGGHTGVYPRLPNLGTEMGRQEIWKSYVDVLEFFVQAGKKVVLVLQAPEVSKPVESLIFMKNDPTYIEGVSLSWWNRRQSFVRARLAEIPSEVVVIDPMPLFCRDQSCLAVKDGVALYFDNNHMSVSGARIVAAQILNSLGVGSQPLLTRQTNGN